MTLLYPLFLWLMVPLILLWLHPKSNFTIKIHLMILLLILLALSRPIQKGKLQSLPVTSHAMIIALDISYSMQGRDIAPTRYAFAKACIKNLLDNNPNDTVMLIAFTSNPLLLSPSTSDHPLLLTALDALRPEYILTKGTSLKKLFALLSKYSTKEQTLVLFTDGGEEQDLKELRDKLLSTGTSLITVGLGTQQGTTLTTKDHTLLRDAQDNLVVSTLNPLLKPLTQSVGGVYITPSTIQETTEAIHHALADFRVLSQTLQKNRYHYQEYYQIPLLIALLLLLLLHTRGVRYLILFFGLFGLSAHASIFDHYHLHQAYTHYQQKHFAKAIKHLNKIETHSLQSQVALANSYYKHAQFKKAITLYKRIHSTNKKVKQQLFYNIANAYALQHRYSKAKTYYIKALQLGEDIATLHNLREILMLQEKRDTIGLQHPKAQSNTKTAPKSDQESQAKEQKKSSDSSGTGGAKGSANKEKNKAQTPQTTHTKREHYPLSSKVYELINKGYIHEKQPW